LPRQIDLLLRVLQLPLRLAHIERVPNQAIGVDACLTHCLQRCCHRTKSASLRQRNNGFECGVVAELSAIALSIKPGGSARSIDIAGGIVTHGERVSPLELHGAVEALRVSGGVVAGSGFDRI
jgi:hypothetical protein